MRCYEQRNLNAETLNSRDTCSCKERTHIFFLKTHKTASSTVMNMLFRFGDTRNLTFAFPKNGHFSYPSYFNSKFVDGFSKESKQEFHIMCHHMRFQLSEVENVMPNDTFYFTILRNPVTQMESSFSYNKNQEVFQKSESLEDFLNNTSKYYRSNMSSSYYAKNYIAFDLGFDNNGRESEKHYKLLCQTVEIMFDLVLIVEYFDESLILLKNALCWTFDDVLSIPINSRSNSSKHSLSEKAQEKIKNWSQLDWHMYVYFNKSFWDQVEKFGRKRMDRELGELRRKRSEMAQVCIQGESDPNKMTDKSLSPYQSGIARIIGHNLKPGLNDAEKQFCQKLVTPEIQYTNLLKRKNMTSPMLPPSVSPYIGFT
ncbi:galactose-3-O-sulfotransferase 2-like [Pelobates fuscus]|uniref:galactose-3-O-sulfotransferase 2-like n=1 Tax=Pelobates fuscus TaxID=191477 RepID=UPI002FE4F4E0